MISEEVFGTRDCDKYASIISIIIISIIIKNMVSLSPAGNISQGRFLLLKSQTELRSAHNGNSVRRRHHFYDFLLNHTKKKCFENTYW